MMEVSIMTMVRHRAREQMDSEHLSSYAIWIWEEKLSVTQENTKPFRYSRTFCGSAGYNAGMNLHECKQNSGCQQFHSENNPGRGPRRA